MQRVKQLVASPWPYRMIRICLGVLFVWAGVLKLADLEAFAEVISAYDLVPESILGPVAIGLPALELAGGIGLIFDIRGSLGITSGLLALFIFVLWFGILKDLDIDCGCFSPAELTEHGTLREAMYRDVVMMVAVGYLFWWRRAVPVWSPRGLGVLKSWKS